jgi:hypothetical protein
LIATSFNAATWRLGSILLALQLLPLLKDWWLLLHHRIAALLGIRSHQGRQSECRCREHQNVLLHFKPPRRDAPVRINSGRATLILCPLESDARKDINRI